MYNILWAFPDEPDRYTLYSTHPTLKACFYQLSQSNVETGDRIKIIPEDQPLSPVLLLVVP